MSEQVLARLREHLDNLRTCQKCPGMQGPPVFGHPVRGGIMIVGQAPGIHEPRLARPFAWTAGRTLFAWLNQSLGLDELEAREKIYFSAVCRCFPGKNPTGGDRVPNSDEIENCSPWMKTELELIRPRLVLAVGKLAISQFLARAELAETVGKVFEVKWEELRFQLLPLPHPSGVSAWPHQQPGKRLLARALGELGALGASNGLV